MGYALNKVMLIGNLGRDPETRYTKDGKPVANITIATSEKWRNKQGDQQEKTEWHRVVIFGKLADIVKRYLRKGSKVYVEGQLQTKKWTDKNGQDRYTTEVVVGGFGGNIIMLDSRGGDGGGNFAQSPFGGTQENASQSGFQPDIPSHGGGNQQQPTQQQPPAAAAAATTTTTTQKAPDQNNTFNPADDFDDDIPF